MSKTSTAATTAENLPLFRKLRGLYAVLVYFLGLAALDAFAGLPGESVSNLSLYGFLAFTAFAGANYGEHREKSKELAAWAPGAGLPGGR